MGYKQYIEDICVIINCYNSKYSSWGVVIYVIFKWPDKEVSLDLFQSIAYVGVNVKEVS